MTIESPGSPVFSAEIFRQLRDFAGELLEPGLEAPVHPGRGDGADASISVVRSMVRELTLIVPSLVRESAAVGRFGRTVEIRLSAVPRRARASTRPWHYVDRGGEVLPSKWLAEEPQSVPDTRALGWLLHLLQHVSKRLESTTRRVRKHLVAAQRVRRAVRSYFAAAERDRLIAQQRDLTGDEWALARAQLYLRNQAIGPICGSERAPRPYPTSPAWLRLRRLARRIVDPDAYLRDWVAEIKTAPLPFLYQRWCGVQILHALEQQGFIARRDPTAALFLGGMAVSFCDRAGREIELWFEPRLLESEVHASGLRAYRVREQTPDFLFVTSGPGGPDAFVLDATLSTHRDELLEKDQYRHSLVFEAPRTIAGQRVRGRVHPERSWSMAPLDSRYCRLDDPDGRTGVIPTHPLNPASHALRDWLRDVTYHARAWATVRASNPG